MLMRLTDIPEGDNHQVVAAAASMLVAQGSLNDQAPLL
jgi:hypothetical protein